jgi:hypothetical protein
MGTFMGADRMQQRLAIGYKAVVRDVDITGVVACADVIKQADRKHRIEALVRRAVSLQPGLYRQITARPTGVRLRVIQGDANADDAVTSGRQGQRPAPAAADVEPMHARPRIKLATDQSQFRLPRGIQVGGAGPVAAAAVQALHQHQVAAEIVVPLARRIRAASALPIEQIDRLAVVIPVGLANAQRALRKCTRKHPIVVNHQMGQTHPVSAHVSAAE